MTVPKFMNTLWPDFYRFVSSRRLQARMLSTLLCAIIVVLKPFSHFGRRSAFLAIVIKELVFSPQENLPQQIEATFFNLVGGLSGVSLSSFGKFITSLAYDRAGDTTLTRCIPGLTLALICFLAGGLKSWLPRLTLAGRIVCFVSIWLLTRDVGSPQNIRDDATAFIWVIGVAAVTSVFSSMTLLKWSTTQFAVELVSALSELRTCLHSNLSEHISGRCKKGAQSPAYAAPADLLGRSVSLDKLYQQAYFDLRIGRLSVKALKPLIITVEHLRRILSRPLVIPESTPSNGDEDPGVAAAFRRSTLDLGAALVQSLSMIEEQILACYNAPSMKSTSGTKSTIPEIEAHLTETVNTVRTHLERISRHLGIPKKKYSVGMRFSLATTYDSCACMLFILEMAEEIQFSLKVVQEIRTCYDKSKPRLWLPRFSLAWLGVAPTVVSMHEKETYLDEGSPEDTLLSEREAFMDHVDIDEQQKKFLTKKGYKIRGQICSLQWLRSLSYSSWNHPQTLRARIRLFRFKRTLQGSPHLRHAFKNAIGVALLSLPAYLEHSTPGRKWFDRYYGQWMVISFVWVLETNTGATIRVGYLRLIGTLLGAIYAWVATLFCRTNPYALVTMMVFAELPISWIIMKSTFSPMGTVAAVTLPPILFTPYFQPTEQDNTWKIALLRAGLISVGIVAALLANSLFFARHCRVLFLTRVCQTLGLSNQLFMNMSRALFHPAYPATVRKKRTYKLEREMRGHLYKLAILLKTMDNEVGLIPTPMRRYRKILNALHRLSNLLSSIRKARQQMPNKVAATAVAPQRRELVSCVCISLFASEQVFRARQPLPQFLPSSRAAFLSLERGVEEHLSQHQQGTSEFSGMSRIYIFAELDLLAELVDTVEEIVDLTRQLFGTSTWLSQTGPVRAGMTSVHGESAVGTAYEGKI